MCELGTGRRAEAGANAGLSGLASGAEVLASSRAPGPNSANGCSIGGLSTLAESQAREATLSGAIEALEARIAAARPDIPRQDVERLRRSADEALRQQQARERQIV